MKLKNNKQIFIFKEFFQEVYDYITKKESLEDELFCIYQDVFSRWLYDIKEKVEKLDTNEEIKLNKYEIYSFYQILILAKKEKYNMNIYDIKNSKSFQKNIKELGIFDNIS
tara:strand:- start:80740 stop:81072 length:333 start_codon:yes stop_codon:yes gene_type:complete